MGHIQALALIFFLSALSDSPSSFGQETNADNLCFTLQKNRRLCGARELFGLPIERDLLVSSFKTVSNFVTLPQLIRINVTRNSSMATTIIWVSDGTALYAMAVGGSFKEAIDILMRVIRDKPKNKPFVIPYEKIGKEKCFGKDPEPCA